VSRSYFHRLAASFRCAGAGVWFLVKTQPNAQIHLAATVLAVGAGCFFRIDRLEWCFLAFAITAVWVAEALNTVLELFLDAVHPEHNPLIGRAKDVAAGAVLLAAVGAVVVGLLVFAPRILASAPH
jgi:diacylglycerol kinase (ATP)